MDNTGDEIFADKVGVMLARDISANIPNAKFVADVKSTGLFATDPVLIRNGALAPGLPLRDMLVSPQHRMLIANATAQMLFGEDEVLVAAVHLLGQPGILRQACAAVSYIHIMCDAHQIVLADGVWSESFQPAGRMLQGMPGPQQAELLALFPDLDTVTAFPAARLSLKAHEARVLLAV